MSQNSEEKSQCPGSSSGYPGYQQYPSRPDLYPSQPPVFNHMQANSGNSAAQQHYPPSQFQQQAYPPSQFQQQAYPPPQFQQQAYAPPQFQQQAYPPPHLQQHAYPPPQFQQQPSAPQQFYPQPPFQQQGYSHQQLPQQGYSHQQAPQQVYSHQQAPQQGNFNPSPTSYQVAPQFVTHSPLVLLMVEKTMGSYSNDDFRINDQFGNPWFTLDAKAFSMSSERVLLDRSGLPVLTLKKSMFSIGKKWLAYRGKSSSSSDLLFSVEPKVFTFKPHINVYLNDGDREPDFKISGNFTGRNFQIFDKRNGTKRLIASCEREHKFASMNAFLNSMINADVYYLQLQPGSDAAFVVSVCLLLDEFYNDN